MNDRAILPPTEPLRREHNREAFSCGRLELDRYLKERALQDQSRRIAICWILSGNKNPTEILGYYTLSAYAVRPGDLPESLAKKLPRYPTIPAALLGRLAVDENHKGRRLGEHLLIDAMRRTLEQSAALGIYALFVDAKDAQAAVFYARYDFMPLPSAPLRLFLPMQTIVKVLE
jgi:GNAT superfamily N-acetyltransferase